MEKLITDDRNKDQCSTKVMGKNPIDSLRGVDSHFKNYGISQKAKKRLTILENAFNN